MRLINTKAHGIYDYLMGALLIMSPFLFDYANGSISHNIAVAMGVYLWISASATNYEFGLLKVLGLKYHLFLDLLAGLFLCISVFAFSQEVEAFKPHLVFGLSIIGVSLLSDRMHTREVKILMKKGKHSKHNTKELIRAKRENLPGMPELKLILDPFDALSLKIIRKETPAHKPKK